MYGKGTLRVSDRFPCGNDSSARPQEWGGDAQGMATGTYLGGGAEVAEVSALIRSSVALAGLHWGRTWADTCLVDTGSGRKGDSLRDGHGGCAECIPYSVP